MKFIEVTEKYSGRRVLLNLDAVTTVEEQSTSTCFTFCTNNLNGDPNLFFSGEWFNEIKEKIANG